MKKGAPVGHCDPPENLKGVQVVFEDQEGNLRCFWVDLEKVQGISWCDSAPPDRGKPPKGKKPAHVPPPDDLEKCEPLTAQEAAEYSTFSHVNDPFDDPPLCWWDGNDWECGEM